MNHICGLPDFGTYAGQVTLVAPEWLRQRWPDGISIDVCLALEMQTLWKAGIHTNGHCCGHGKADPYIGVDIADVPKMIAMGYVEQKPQHFWPKSA